MSSTKDDLDDAIARHYARQQEGLPPPAPSTAHLWRPWRQYLDRFYPVPRPPGGWVRPIPSFDWWLQQHGIARHIADGAP